VIKIRD
jgi:ATP-dependent RNA helicase DDX46/PRP5